MTAPLRIKKYSNRRLYDTEISAYITLTELADRIRAGRRVTVEDAKSGADLTRQVLLQVILEEQERLEMLPPEMLHQIIRVQGTLQAGPLTSFLAESWKGYAAMSGSVSQQAGEVLGAMANPLGAMASGPMAAWMQAAGFGGAKAASKSANPAPPTESAEPAEASEPAPEPEAPSDAAADSVAESVEQLRRQMDELLGRLKG